LKNQIVPGETFTVVFLDLDGFKNINDTLGHSVGDKLLKAVGQRLLHSVREEDIVSRFGGDEFSLILPSVGASEAGFYAKGILDELGKSFTVDDADIYISPSIGLSVYPQDGETAETLINHADAAMSHAKSIGKNN